MTMLITAEITIIIKFTTIMLMIKMKNIITKNYDHKGGNSTNAENQILDIKYNNDASNNNNSNSNKSDDDANNNDYNRDKDDACNITIVTKIIAIKDGQNLHLNKHHSG